MGTLTGRLVLRLQDDEVSRGVGIKHAAPRIPADAIEFLGRSTRIPVSVPRSVMHVLHVFGGLPEEEIRTDSGAEDGAPQGTWTKNSTANISQQVNHFRKKTYRLLCP